MLDFNQWDLTPKINQVLRQIRTNAITPVSLASHPLRQTFRSTWSSLMIAIVEKITPVMLAIQVTHSRRCSGTSRANYSQVPISAASTAHTTTLAITQSTMAFKWSFRRAKRRTSQAIQMPVLNDRQECTSVETQSCRLWSSRKIRVLNRTANSSG
ncbi:MULTISPECIES: hypothetical protein [Pseudomonas]|uniref:hypothetical protein n=1 Tax=Pseudomonas TaxID=286 RepID=UPI00387AAA44